MLKRGFDFISSLIGLVVLTPVFGVIALAIKRDSEGPVFFAGERIGRDGKLFKILKFRTMVESPEAHNGPRINTRDDARITRLGRFLRDSKLNELPQLINVLRGEMTLVGPRPCLPYEAEEYLRWHKNRFDIRPGITGLWQVSGKNKLPFKQMIRLDISYLRNLSLWLDIKILLLTFPAIVQFVFDAVKNQIRGYKVTESPTVESETLTICQILETFAERF